MSAADHPVSTAGHEHRDISPATVLRWGAGIFALLILSATAMWFLLGRYDRELAAESPAPSPLGRADTGWRLTPGSTGREARCTPRSSARCSCSPSSAGRREMTRVSGVLA